MNTELTGRRAPKWGKAALWVGLVSLAASASLLSSARLGIGSSLITVRTLVYAHCLIGVIGCVGVGFAFVSIARREEGVLYAVGGGILNLLLAVSGSTFFILLPK